MLDRTLRIVLIVLNLFLGANAIIGAIWVIPALPAEWLQGTPFSSFLIPALSLAVLVGGGALSSVVALLQGRWWAPLGSMLTGLAIVIFEVVETATLNLNVWLHLVGLQAGPVVSRLPLNADGTIPFAMWLQPFVFAYGVVLFGLALGLWMRHAPVSMRLYPQTTAA